MRIAATLPRLALPKMEANTYAVVELFEPGLIPLRILACWRCRFAISCGFGVRFRLLGNGLWQIWLALGLVWTGTLKRFRARRQGGVKNLPAKCHFVQHIVKWPF